MSSIGELEESKATLRLLITLYKIGKPIMLSHLYPEMRGRYALGRRTVDTALETCTKMGLVKRETKRIGKNPMPSIFHSLTKEGKECAEVILKLVKAVESALSKETS